MQRPLPAGGRQFCIWMIAILCVAAVGCRPDSGGRTSREKPEIALIMKSLANEFFITMREGAEQHHRENADAYDLIVSGIKNESDLAEQVELVNQMVARGVDAIVIAPADSKALVTVLKRAQAQGILVVNIDNKLDDDVLRQAGIDVPFVGPDNREGARMVGAYLAERLQPGDEVAILEGIPTAFNAQQRRQGFEEAMAAAGMRVVAVQSGQWEMKPAADVSAGILNEFPNLKAILASNDSMALGAVAARKAAGREAEVQIVGFDNISAIRELVKDGRVLATADQHADQLAVYGIEFALQLVRGEVRPEDKRTPVDLVTAETLR